jgi:hypothetical protein
VKPCCRPAFVSVTVLVVCVHMFSSRVQSPRIQRRVGSWFLGEPISQISFLHVRCQELGHWGPVCSEHDGSIRAERFMHAVFRVRLPAAFHDAAGTGKLASSAISESRPESSHPSKLVGARVPFISWSQSLSGI